MTDTPIIAVSIGAGAALEIATASSGGIPTRVVELLGHPAAAFFVVGADRSTAGSGVGVDPSIVAAVLLAASHDAAVLVAAWPGADHPYNLARRILSLDHLSGGRSGVLLPGTASVDRRSGGAANWIPDSGDADIVRETLAILDELWAAWPLDAFPADQPTGRYVDTDRIQHTNHEGVYSVLGPLTAPGSVQGLPVRAQLVEPGEAPLPGIDLAIQRRRAVDNPDHAGARTGTVLFELDSLAGIPDLVHALDDHPGVQRQSTLRETLRLPLPATPIPNATPAFLEGSSR